MKHNWLRNVVTGVAAVSMLAGVLSGCGGGDTPTGKTGGAETITVWTDSASTKEVMNELIQNYNNTEGKEKGIQIDYQVYGDNYTQMLDLAISSDQQPELFKAQGGVLETYASSGKVMSIEDLPGGQEYLKKFDGLLTHTDHIFGGKTYAVPYSVNTVGLLYNKDLFKKAGIVDENGEAKPPVTWDELCEDAKKITNPQEKVYGIALPLKWEAYYDWEMRFPFFSTVGDDFFNHKSGKFDFASYKPALEWLLQIKNDNSYFPGAEGLDNDTARAQFAEGRVGMKFGAVWDVGVFNDQFVAKMDWGVAPMPKAEADSPNLQFALSTSNLCVGSTASKKDLSKVMAVFDWMHSDEVLAKLYEESMVIPYDPKIMEKAEREPNQKGWKEFAALLDVSKNVTLQPNLKIEGIDYKQVFSKIWVGELGIDEGLADLDTRYNAALDKAVADGSVDLQQYSDPNFDPTVVK